MNTKTVFPIALTPGNRFLDIDAWKKLLLREVAAKFCEIARAETQKKVGVWQWNDGIPYPSEEDIAVTDGGSLSFTLDIGNTPVFFSLWVQFGEMRVGVRVPLSLTSKSGSQDQLSRAFDGNQCNRIVHSPGGHFYDWIFRDGIADLRLMTDSIHEEMLRLVIADRLAGILTHLYMAITNFLIDANGLKVAFSRLFSPTRDCRRILVVVSDDVDAFEQWVFPARGSVISRHPQENGAVLFLVETINQIKPSFLTGPCRDVDGSVFVIRSVEEVKPTES